LFVPANDFEFLLSKTEPYTVEAPRADIRLRANFMMADGFYSEKLRKFDEAGEKVTQNEVPKILTGFQKDLMRKWTRKLKKA
jgi:hypothetical protein